VKRSTRRVPRDRSAARDRIPPRDKLPARGPQAARSRWSGSIGAVAILPLRAFLGFTFLYAGLDKLLDPAFLDAASPSSIHAQMLVFARLSPLGDLVRASLPFATPIGVLIAIGEIGAGVGVLSGLAYRVAAGGGAALSLLFWLTNSWATHPYYYGGDLPYMFGFITLAIAGHGELLLGRRLIASSSGESPTGPGGVRSPERRILLQTGLLASFSLIVASLAVPLRALGLRLDSSAAAIPTTEPSSSAVPGPAGSGSGSPAPSTSGAGIQVATIAAVQQAGSAAFRIPFNAPSPMPAGDPGVIVQLKDGSFVAFDAICTHAGCTVEWDATDAVLLCPCHSAAFDPAHDGAVIGGPAPTPLAKLPIRVDTASGSIFLAG
jgi:thiosulfate dehydrogenase [quinone] large subunit